MRKQRFLDVNGLNAAYDVPLEKRLNKYRKVHYKDTSRPTISDAEIYRMRAVSWRNQTRRRQVVSAVAIALVAALAIFVAWGLTYGFPWQAAQGDQAAVEQPVEGQAAEEQAAGEQPAEGQAAEEAPAEGQEAEEAPAEGQAAEEAAEGQAAEEAPAEGQAVEEAVPDEAAGEVPADQVAA